MCAHFGVSTTPFSRHICKVVSASSSEQKFLRTRSLVVDPRGNCELFAPHCHVSTLFFSLSLSLFLCVLLAALDCNCRSIFAKVLRPTKMHKFSVCASEWLVPARAHFVQRSCDNHTIDACLCLDQDIKLSRTFRVILICGGYIQFEVMHDVLYLMSFLGSQPSFG